MKVSINWLKDYVDLDGIPAKEIADKLTQITCEVESIEEKGRGLDGVIVGKVIKCGVHSAADRLHVLTVDIGAAKPLTIVCGAANARAGIFVAVATAGTTLPSGLKILKSEIRGAESQGMCCSYSELGYSGEDGGIAELSANSVIGEKITAVLPGIVDDILDIDNKSITNRPDLWGHYGIARELSVIFNRKFREVKTDNIAKYDGLPKLDIRIENDDCLSYGAIKIKEIGGIQSPDIIANRLWYLGHNSHGFLVDITNYVMFAFGNPIHAFDGGALAAGKGLQAEISVGNIKAGEKFKTLKDSEIIAASDMLFIKSGGRPVALAGIMGGKDSEIKPDTKDVVFEVATFDASRIRRTSVDVGIRSDASARYEKSLDPETNRLAASEILRLVGKYGKTAAVVSAFTRAVGKKALKTSKEIVVNKAYLEQFVGVKFNYKTVEKTLSGLGFAPKITDDKITVAVPSWRAWKDITTPADVIEEIVRNFGYNNIPTSAPKTAAKPTARDKNAAAADKIKDIISGKYGYCEVHTNIWYDTKALKTLNLESPSHLTVLNSYAKDDNRVRSEILPSMLTVALANKSKKEICIFEIGRVISGLFKSGLAEEEVRFGGVTTADSYLEVAHMLADIFGTFGMNISFALSAVKENKFHPKNNAYIIWDGVRVGSIGIIHPHVMQNAVGFEINLSAFDFNKVKERKAYSVSKYPKTNLDFTFVWDGVYADLNKKFEKFQNPFVQDRCLTGIYGNKYTITFTVGSFEKTLTADEIGVIHKEIIDFAASNGVNLN
jgi:phenylalanyl-tRNA synthetase beta chain